MSEGEKSGHSNSNENFLKLEKEFFEKNRLEGLSLEELVGAFDCFWKVFFYREKEENRHKLSNSGEFSLGSALYGLWLFSVKNYWLDFFLNKFEKEIRDNTGRDFFVDRSTYDKTRVINFPGTDNELIVIANGCELLGEYSRLRDQTIKIFSEKGGSYKYFWEKKKFNSFIKAFNDDIDIYFRMKKEHGEYRHPLFIQLKEKREADKILIIFKEIAAKFTSDLTKVRNEVLGIPEDLGGLGGKLRWLWWWLEKKEVKAVLKLLGLLALFGLWDRIEAFVLWLLDK